ncbi:MAG: S49 family peptidase [Propionibacteriaceae bacterium]|nr:S49 family peptidase [Propionibacteriaceae bacterium]
MNEVPEKAFEARNTESGVPSGSIPSQQPRRVAPEQFAAAPAPQLLVPQVTSAPVVPKRKGFGYGFGAGSGFGIGFGTVLSIGMMVSTLLAVVILAAVVPGDSGARYEVIWGDYTAANTVRAININGTIMADARDGTTSFGGTYGYEIADIIDQIKAEDSAGLLLVLNTPGGSINGSWAIAEAVTRYQERTGHKVVAIVQGMSASGGMLAMAGVDQIIADYGSIVGSIGVIMGPFEYYDQVTSIDGGLLNGGVTASGGITQEYITQGWGKDAGNPFRKLTTDERAMLTNLIASDYQKFVAHVAAGRKLSTETITNDFGASLFSGDDAVKNGLIDAVMGRNEAFSAAATTMGLNPADTRFIAPAMPSFIDQLLGANARIPGVAPVLSSDPTLRLSATLCGTSPTTLAYYGDAAALCR